MQAAYDTYLATRHLERATLADQLHHAEQRVEDIAKRLAALDTPDPAHFPPPHARKVDDKRRPVGGNPDTRRQLDFHRKMLAQLGGSRTCVGERAEPFAREFRGANSELSR